MGMFWNEIKWIRSLDDESMDEENTNKGYIVVEDPNLIDKAAKHIRKNMKASEKYVSYGNYEPLVHTFAGLPDGPVIEHYECTVPPVGHALTSKLHCARRGEYPFIIEMTYETPEELSEFLKPTGLMLEDIADIQS